MLVVPNLRGGGEFGSDWHKGGTKERKQQVFDDLRAYSPLHDVRDGAAYPPTLAV